MSGATFILAINLAVAGLFASAFVAVAIYDRTHMAARWCALSFVFGMLDFLAEFAVPLAGGAHFMVLIAYAAFMAALIALNTGLARFYERPVPWKSMLVIFAAGLATQALTADMARESLVRMTLYQAPYAALQAVSAYIVLCGKWRSWRDRALSMMLVVTAIHYLAKPFVARATGGMGQGPADYLSTVYAMFSQSLGTVLGITVALTLLSIMVRELLARIAEESETDKLSGLLNRRGFENSREAVMREQVAKPVPVSLVICDLDDFKSVNDGHGHAAGDAVIAAFGALLEQSVGEQHYAARIGGEEFAILLPGCNLVTAWLVAENVRSAFAALTVEDMTGELRCTASFGVAEHIAGESASDMQRRADEALYAAKRSGKDRVVIARSIDGLPARRAGEVTGHHDVNGARRA